MQGGNHQMAGEGGLDAAVLQSIYKRLRSVLTSSRGIHEFPPQRVCYKYSDKSNNNLHQAVRQTKNTVILLRTG